MTETKKPTSHWDQISTTVYRSPDHEREDGRTVSAFMFDMPSPVVGGCGVVFEHRDFGYIPLATTDVMSSGHDALMATHQLMNSPDLPHWNDSTDD